jgi:hypothetical protein
MLMLLISAPVFIEDPVGRRFLERAALEQVRLGAGRSGSFPCSRRFHGISIPRH